MLMFRFMFSVWVANTICFNTLMDKKHISCCPVLQYSKYTSTGNACTVCVCVCVCVCACVCVCVCVRARVRVCESH